jgi:uncharacterized protein YndB with AHSA1/START domain
MPRVARARTLNAPREAIWRVVSDPHHLPRWWPNVKRVEDASSEKWTKVLQAGRGRPVRADFTRVRFEPPHALAWRQELAQSPFERILSESLTELSLEPEGAGATRVEIRARQKLRGLARLGWLMVRRATRRQIDEALAGLDRISGTEDPAAARRAGG